MRNNAPNIKRGLFVLISLLLTFAARAADFAVTMYYSLDLSAEANPLVSQLGLGWAALIAANILVLIILGAGAIFWWQRPMIF
ncbi:MAG: hypothetical protein GY869_02905, partial [Planctomycetes bacterium]|nr:hypothetical protein [Planctomycetota bacterium]